MQQTLPFETPIIVMGIDLSFQAKHSMEALEAARRKGVELPEPDAATMEAEICRRE